MFAKIEGWSIDFQTAVSYAAIYLLKKVMSSSLIVLLHYYQIVSMNLQQSGSHSIAADKALHSFITVCGVELFVAPLTDSYVSVCTRVRTWTLSTCSKHSFRRFVLLSRLCFLSQTEALAVALINSRPRSLTPRARRSRALSEYLHFSEDRVLLLISVLSSLALPRSCISSRTCSHPFARIP